MSIIRMVSSEVCDEVLDERVTVHVFELMSMSFTMPEIAAAWRRCMEKIDDALYVSEATE